MAIAESPYGRFVIKSFKHDGSLHRVWQENWIVPEDRLDAAHAGQEMRVLLNDRTTIVESDGKEWISRVPAVSFFLPNRWYNVVALLEERGVRYYCNLSSPCYQYGNVLTYIDYDLDVVVMPNGDVVELDRDEFERHKLEYRYGESVIEHVQAGLLQLREAIAKREAPFGDAAVRRYYEQWKKQSGFEGERDRP